MTTPLTIAILGASGTVGPFLLQALAAHPSTADVRIRILTRSTSLERVESVVAEHGPSLTITVHVIDYTSTNTGLDEGLRGVDVVISAVGNDSGLTKAVVRHCGLLPGFLTQDAVARAAKVAEVKLFIPSEYGAPTHSLSLDSEEYTIGKRYHHDLLRKLDLPFLLIYSGKFVDVEPAPTPLPQLTAEAPIPAGETTTRYHLATYIVQLLLDRGIEEVAGGIYALRGLRRDKGIVAEDTGKTQWVLDV
ncbi:hypothetical protein DFH09DRAFT_1288259 [Mycena vulgaris]|nr:hypothetical protein DFH09DRAFT_1288259 [Mycena vulgaris]